MPFGESAFPPDPNANLIMPNNLGKMIELAGILSKGFPFVRIDFYDVFNSIFFGEITFYPASGFGGFTSKEWDKNLGDMINLPTEISEVTHE